MYAWICRLSLCAFSVLLGAQVLRAADLAAAKAAYQKRDWATAFKEISPLAKQGNPDAEVLLGRMYLMGYGVLKDQDYAYKLFRNAAEQGNPDAEFLVGAPSVMRHVDIPEGLNYLKLSAGQGNKDAQLLLGKTYLSGFPPYLTRDPVKAEMWLTLAAKENLPFYHDELRVSEEQMSPDAIAKGKALAAAWKPQHGIKPGDKPKSAAEAANGNRASGK